MEGKYLVLVAMWISIGLIGIKNGWAAFSTAFFAIFITAAVLSQ